MEHLKKFKFFSSYSLYKKIDIIIILLKCNKNLFSSSKK